MVVSLLTQVELSFPRSVDRNTKTVTSDNPNFLKKGSGAQRVYVFVARPTVGMLLPRSCPNSVSTVLRSDYWNILVTDLWNSMAASWRRN